VQLDRAICIRRLNAWTAQASAIRDRRDVAVHPTEMRRLNSWAKKNRPAGRFSEAMLITSKQPEQQQPKRLQQQPKQPKQQPKRPKQQRQQRPEQPG
jgi:hypothetical protein